MTARRVSAVVLAGGRSSRFGRDKLAELVDGRPLLSFAIDAVRPLATEIIVVAAPGASATLPDDVTVAHDPVAFEGPLAGLLVGLAVAREPIVLVVGGDMPTLVGAVLESMLAWLDPPGGPQAVVLEHEGRPRPLPMVVLRQPALVEADRLIAAGERRLRSLSEGLTTRVIHEPTWRAIDPEGLTLSDIDTPADLA